MDEAPARSGEEAPRIRPELATVTETLEKVARPLSASTCVSPSNPMLLSVRDTLESSSVWLPYASTILTRRSPLPGPTFPMVTPAVWEVAGLLTNVRDVAAAGTTWKLRLMLFGEPVLVAKVEAPTRASALRDTWPLR